MNDYAGRQLAQEQNLLVVVSTHGEGEPPVSAEELHQFLGGPRAPKLPNLKFSVLALGDTSYLHFCQTGKDFDERLARAANGKHYRLVAQGIEHEHKRILEARLKREFAVAVGLGARARALDADAHAGQRLLGAFFEHRAAHGQ
jgi:flavodoxin